jgi:predicted nucleic acid-binding protein
LTAYVDTSLLVAYYCPEPLSTQAEALIHEGGPPAISPLTEVEVCSALAIKVRTGELDAATARSLFSEFQWHVEEDRYHVLTMGAREHRFACGWISHFATPLRTVDALHLAVAHTNGLMLLTADKRLARSAEHFGVGHKLIS